MSCQVEQFADCGDIASLGRALFVSEKEDTNWLSQCSVSLSSCGTLLAVGFKKRLCLLITQWISSTDSHTYLISWSGTLPSDITAVLALSICPSQHSSQNGPDWFCILVGFKNGSIGFYTNTGHLLLLEKLNEKSVLKISCHTGTYGTLPDDIHIFFESCECIVSGSSLFQTLRNAKAQLARVQAGVQGDYLVDSRSIHIKKWIFSDQEQINDASVVGLELKNTYDHLLAASTYGGYDTWYRSIPPMNILIFGTGVKPYIGFHYALEGGTAPPLQDVAKAVANKIKSALPGWLGGGSAENMSTNIEPLIRSEPLSMRMGLHDQQRHGTSVTISPDRRLAAITDSLGRVAILDVNKGHLIRLFKGYRDAQCAFVQIFEHDKKKPQLSIIKEIRRAIFLIIYNPKKGLIDIRLMQRGNRIAVFTATKNGKLIYNTCGLVGAEKTYTHKKLNLPEFQCILIDPDGKLKKFNIPFFYALEGEHSDRSKDLHIIRELRDYIKKLSSVFEENENEIIKRASNLKTLDLKKHCLEMLIKNDISPKIVMSSLHVFWNSIAEAILNAEKLKVKYYFENLGLVTLFYRHINNEATDDMQELLDKIHQDINLNNKMKAVHNLNEERLINDFHLLEDDNCILERLLILAQRRDYKEQDRARVTFADHRAHTYKEFISCFVLDEKTRYITLKSDTSVEKLNNLASVMFDSILKMDNLKLLSKFVLESKVDPKEVLKLVIMHLMNMSLEEITIELIEKFIEVSYYICRVTEEAGNIVYNEISPWWESIRILLIEMPCPLKSMIVAMACKAAVKIFESISSEGEDEAWESVTAENAKWSILIGKLEDISILSIILMYKDTFIGKSLPKLQVTDFNINLKYIYTRGKGSVTELIAKWLCSMGVLPEAVVANELIELRAQPDYESDPDDDGSPSYLFVANNQKYVDDNDSIFKWLMLLRQQFPLSTSANYIIANMCWEYALSWQKDMQKTEELKAVVHCLKNVTDLHIRFGLFSIIWSTYIKNVFEASCRLVNKVGKLPKESLCLQDVGLSDENMLKFLEITKEFLDNFLACLRKSLYVEKKVIHYEKIWNDSMPSLVEVARDSKKVDNDILNLNYQISCSIYYQCHFNIKFTKPLDTLYDIDYQYIFEALTGTVAHREINMKASEKLGIPRMKFLTKLIRAAIETITWEDSDELNKTYNSREFSIWLENITVLAELWNIDEDFVTRQQVIGLYHLGYDTLAEKTVLVLKDPDPVLPSLLAITTQRLKRSLENSNNKPEWIVTLPPQLYARLQNTVLDPSIPANPSLTTTITMLRIVLNKINSKYPDTPPNKQNIKLAELMISSCEVLLTRKM